MIEHLMSSSLEGDHQRCAAGFIRLHVRGLRSHQLIARVVVCATGAVHTNIFRSIRYLPNPVPRGIESVGFGLNIFLYCSSYMLGFCRELLDERNLAVTCSAPSDPMASPFPWRLDANIAAGSPLCPSTDLSQPGILPHRDPVAHARNRRHRRRL